MLLNSRRNQVFQQVESNSQNDLNNSNNFNGESPTELYQRIQRQEWYIGSLIILLIIGAFGVFLWSFFGNIKAEENLRDAVFELKSQVVNRELILYLNEKGYKKPDNTEWNADDVGIAYDGILSAGSGAAGTAFVDTSKGRLEVFFSYHPEDGISTGEPILSND